MTPGFFFVTMRISFGMILISYRYYSGTRHFSMPFVIVQTG
jgi:hypothetical protein